MNVTAQNQIAAQHVIRFGPLIAQTTSIKTTTKG